ncbi:hypothetical protein PMW_24 [Pseudomonas phage phiPMW]|uniref:Uncharacterized protein n=1 Tax=Pseudomonas phage phiPMW TaxID=1815582 RepID=A0A1S5R183_9CAUD|nr:hypothetical protein FDG97_gp024 [Pseudomonas phage phiPMW]ANA49149.1 hypothetical protein PMW_24 [Pseudomonas phage phiPMW]
MQASKVKVRLKDIRHGVKVFTAHPAYGIDECTLLSRPFHKRGKIVGSLGNWVKVRVPVSTLFDDRGYYEAEHSLRDMGITSTYNDRRTFFKRKHAEQWMDQQSMCPRFQARQADHEEWCKTLDWYMDDM